MQACAESSVASYQQNLFGVIRRTGRRFAPRHRGLARPARGVLGAGQVGASAPNEGLQRRRDASEGASTWPTFPHNRPPAPPTHPSPCACSQPHVLPSPLYADGPGGRPLLGSAPTPLHSRATVRPLSTALLALSLTCVLPIPSPSTHRLPTATATCASWPTTLHGSWTNWASQTSKVMWIIRISRECACCDVV